MVKKLKVADMRQFAQLAEACTCKSRDDVFSEVAWTGNFHEAKIDSEETSGYGPQSSGDDFSIGFKLTNIVMSKVYDKITS